MRRPRAASSQSVLRPDLFDRADLRGGCRSERGQGGFGLIQQGAGLSGTTLGGANPAETDRSHADARVA